MPQDPYPKIRFGPVQQPGQTGRSPAEAQFEQAAYSQFLPQAQADPYQVEAGAETAWKGLDPEAQQRLASLRAALESRIAKGKQDQEYAARRETLKGPLENLKKTQGLGTAVDKFSAGLFTPILGGIDTAADIGANLGDQYARMLASQGGTAADMDRMAAMAGQPQDTRIYDMLGLQAPTQRQAPQPRPLVESGFLEATTGASTPGEARVQLAREASPLSGPERAHLRAQMEEDKQRIEQGLQPILSQQEYEQIATLDDPGLAGMAGDTIAMLLATPNVASKAKGIVGLGERLAKGAAAWGATRGVTEQSVEAGLHDATFGAGMEAAGAGIDKGLNNRKAQALLAAVSLARNSITRYLGRTAAETAKLRAGRVAASFLPGGETPYEAMTASPLGELGPAAAFATVTGKSQAGLNRRVDITQRRRQSLERGAQNRQQKEAEATRAAEAEAQARRDAERAAEDADLEDLRGVADEIEGRLEARAKERTKVTARELRWARKKIEDLRAGKRLSEEDAKHLRTINEIQKRAEAQRKPRKAAPENLVSEDDLADLRNAADEIEGRKRKPRRGDASPASPSGQPKPPKTGPGGAGTAAIANADDAIRLSREIEDDILAIRDAGVDEVAAAANRELAKIRNDYRTKSIDIAGASARLSDLRTRTMDARGRATAGMGLDQIGPPAVSRVVRETAAAPQGSEVQGPRRVEDLDFSELVSIAEGKVGQPSPRGTGDSGWGRSPKKQGKRTTAPEAEGSTLFDQPVEPKPEAPAAVKGTAAPAKLGRKPRAITPAEGAWAAEAIQRKARGEKLTAAENKKLEALKARFDKTKAYEAAQRAEAQAKQEAAASPDPRARLSDKGKSMVEQYTAAIQKPMDAATYKATREQFIRKMKQSAKWNPEVGKATAEVRASEVQTLIDTLDREAPEQVKKFLLDEMQAGQEATLREALKSAKTPQEKSEIRKQIRALKRKTTEVTVDRRAKNREEKITREEPQQDTPTEEAALAEEFQKVEEIQGLVENLDERALIDWLGKNAEAVRADIDAGNLESLRSVLETLPKRATEGGFTINGGPLGQLVTGMYQLTRKGVVGTAQLGKWAAQNYRQIPSKIRDFFVRVVGSFGHRNMLRQGANWAMSHEGERLVNLTPEGRAKDMAVELDRTVREKAAPAKAEFERRTYDPYAKLVEETSKPEWSKGTEQVTAGGSDWHRWEAEAMGKVSPSAELKAGIDIYNREYTPTTWNVADDLGLTNPEYRGKKIKPGDPPYLLQVFSDNLRSEASTATKSDWWKELEKHVQSMPENKGVPAKDITARLDAIRKIYSGDIEIRTATERKVALEFVREITLPGRFKGKDVTEPRLSEVIKQHYRGASFRAGFEGAFRGREIGDMRNEFIERGGNPNRFDRFIEAAQGTNPRFSDWSSRFYAEHPIAREIMRVVRAGYDFKNTLDLTMSGVSALSDVPFGPSAHLFGKRHYKAVGETLWGFTKRILGLDKRDAWQIAKSAQELAMRVSDRTRDMNAPIGERIEQSARIARQHIADIMFRPMNRGLETTSTRAFEMMAEDIAKAVTAGKKIPVGRTRQRRLQEFFQWSDDHAKKFFSGKFTNADMRAATEELAAKLYAASSNPMFRSAALKNPIVRYAFRFASHTTQQLRETVKVLRDLAKAVYTGKDIGFRSSEAAKYLAQQTLKGGGLLAMKALLNGDNVNPWSEDSNLWAKVKNDPLRGIPSMLWDSLWAGGVMGPYAMAIGEVTGMNASPVQEAAEQYSPVAAKIAGLAALTGPVQMIDEAFGFASGAGSYRDQDIYKRLRTIVEKRIPGTRTATNLLVMGGIARGNKDLDNGISAVYRWKRANDRTTFGGSSSDEAGHIQMRRELKEGIRKMDGGQSPADWIATAITAKGDVQGVADSLRKRKILDNNINPEDWEELRAEMGEAQFQAVVEHDQLLEEWARYVSESKPEGEPKSKAQAQRIAERSAQKIQRPGLDERARAAASPRAQQLTEAATELMGSRGTPAASRATERAEELKYKSRRRAATRGMDRTGEEVLQRLRLVRQNQ